MFLLYPDGRGSPAGALETCCLGFTPSVVVVVVVVELLLLPAPEAPASPGAGEDDNDEDVVTVGSPWVAEADVVEAAAAEEEEEAAPLAGLAAGDEAEEGVGAGGGREVLAGDVSAFGGAAS